MSRSRLEWMPGVYGLLAAAALTLALGASAEADRSATSGTASAVSQEELLRRINELQARVDLLGQDTGREGVKPVQLEEAAPKPRFHDKVVAFFKACKTFGREHIGPFLLSDFMFYTSILLVIQWHIRFHLSELIYQNLFPEQSFDRRQVKPMMTLRRMGMNILILGIYYDDNLPGSLNAFVKNRPFFCSIGLVFLDNVVIFYGFMLLGTLLNPEVPDIDQWTDPLDEAEDDGVCPDKFEANNVYEDLTYKFRKVCPIFLVQIMLVAFYVEELNSSKDTKKLENVDFIYWLVAVMFQMHGGDAQVGESFNNRYWRHVLDGKSVSEFTQEVMQRPSLTTTLLSDETPHEGDSGRFSSEDIEALLQDPKRRTKIIKESFRRVGRVWHKVFWVLDMKYRQEWQMRRCMDFLVNSVARGIILYTVPIMVCVEGPLDFVKDLTAVMFITMLDNIDGDPKELEEILVKLKFCIFANKDQKRLWDILNKVTGQNLLVVDEQLPPTLTLVEKAYIEEEEEKFDRISSLAPEKWDEFSGKKKDGDEDDNDP